MAIDTTVGCWQGASGVIQVAVVYLTVLVLVLNLPSAHAQGIVRVAKVEGQARASLTIIIRYLALVFYYSLVLVGVNAVNGSAQHLVVQVFAVKCLAEKVAVVRHVETNTQVKVLAADKVGLHIKLDSFVRDGRNVVPNLACIEEVARQVFFHKQVA